MNPLSPFIFLYKIKKIMETESLENEEKEELAYNSLSEFL
jgi:hypothetical protein